jgi:hypothetical protein
VRRGEYKQVEAMRKLYREEARCQIVADSSLRRGFAEPYLILVDGQMAGCGGVYNQYDPGRLTEFCVMPFARVQALPMFRELLPASEATEIATQTKLLFDGALRDCARNIQSEKFIRGYVHVYVGRASR